MLEAEAYAQIRPWLKEFGLPIRLENSAVPGLPDLVFFSSGRVHWIELKVARHGKIKIQKFQHALGALLTAQACPNRWLFALDKDRWKVYSIGALPPPMTTKSGLFIALADCALHFEFKNKHGLQAILEAKDD